MTLASAITPRAVQWLWWPFVPEGKITAIAGQMGQAKSMWTLWLAAAVSRGQGINLTRPGGVLILAAEDDAEDTTVPRLEAAGADLSRIQIADDVSELTVAALRERCAELDNPKLVVVDPLSEYLAERVDSWKTQHVRRALQPVRAFAQEQSISVALVQHLNRRGNTPDALARIADSQGIPALARSVLVWGPDPADPEGDNGSMKVLTRAKMNLARGSASVAFQIEEAAGPSGIRAPRVSRNGSSDARAEDVTADAETRSGTAEAMGFLRDQLADGPIEADAVKAAAAAADISEKCLRTARERLTRKPRRRGFQGPLVWELREGIDAEQGINGPTQHEGIYGHLWGINGGPGSNLAHGCPDALSPKDAQSGSVAAAVGDGSSAALAEDERWFGWDEQQGRVPCKTDYDDPGGVAPPLDSAALEGLMESELAAELEREDEPDLQEVESL